MVSLVPVPASRQMADNEAEPSCWVCLAPGDQAQPLVQPCGCPRPVHQTCLARWQLQSVGRSEETACRFCYGELPDWRTAYNLPTATPVMTVSHHSVQHLLEVKSGEAGKVEFQQNIRRIFGLRPEDVIELTFGCKAPGTGGTDRAAIIQSNSSKAFIAACFVAQPACWSQEV
ncbi:hypothetical protein WJX77_000365 [Trebouxia sp. C0004]